MKRVKTNNMYPDKKYRIKTSAAVLMCLQLFLCILSGCGKQDSAIPIVDDYPDNKILTGSVEYRDGELTRVNALVNTANSSGISSKWEAGMAKPETRDEVPYQMERMLLPITGKSFGALSRTVAGWMTENHPEQTRFVLSYGGEDTRQWDQRCQEIIADAVEWNRETMVYSIQQDTLSSCGNDGVPLGSMGCVVVMASDPAEIQATYYIWLAA